MELERTDVIPTGVKRRDGRKRTLPCGCVVDDFVYLAFCGAHRDEWMARHQAALGRTSVEPPLAEAGQS